MEINLTELSPPTDEQVTHARKQLMDKANALSVQVGKLNRYTGKILGKKLTGYLTSPLLQKIDFLTARAKRLDYLNPVKDQERIAQFYLLSKQSGTLFHYMKRMSDQGRWPTEMEYQMAFSFIEEVVAAQKAKEAGYGYASDSALNLR